jgi:uncharacterized DUF497 family protein
MFTTDVPFEDFQWDEMKRAKNLVKHGLDFEDAMLALSGPRIELPSVRGGEARVLAICPSEGKTGGNCLHDARNKLPHHLNEECEAK